MVFEQETEIIVMVTNEVEGGMLKCDRCGGVSGVCLLTVQVLA